MRLPRWVMGAASGALLAAEGGLVHAPLSDALARDASVNVVGEIPARDQPRRTLCLMAHLDSSRSGLLFDPRLAAVVRRLPLAQTVAAGTLLAAPALGDGRAACAAIRCARAVNLVGLALLAERELRGVDVPGANDNASGAAAVVTLAAELASAPLSATRVVCLICGCEESGLLGARAFLDARDTDGLDVRQLRWGRRPGNAALPARGGPGRAPGRPIRDSSESPRRIRVRRPELGLEPLDRPLGLTYDATAVLARGGRALTLVAGDDGRIPNYHQPSDTVANLDPERLERALEVGRELIAAVDRGEADPA